MSEQLLNQPDADRVPQPPGAGRVQRSEPERSDGSRSGAQPAPSGFVAIPVVRHCTSVPLVPRP